MRVGFQRHVRGHRFDVRRGDGCGGRDGDDDRNVCRTERVSERDWRVAAEGHSAQSH